MLKHSLLGIAHRTYVSMEGDVNMILVWQQVR
jgi:hypothetical protein